MRPQKVTKGAKTRKSLFGFLCLFVAIWPGCRHSNEKHYDFKGKIVAVDPDRHQVTVSHEDIKRHKRRENKEITFVVLVPLCGDLAGMQAQQRETLRLQGQDRHKEA